MKKTGFAILLTFLSFLTAYPQDLQTWIDSQKSVIYEKVYLHIDREFYSQGDIIWFKTYLVNGLTNQLLPGFKNIYVQLVSDKGKVYADRIILSEKGISRGDFLIADSLPDGHYIIRAYTKYLGNFKEKSYFHKGILISRAKSSPEIKNAEDIPPKLDIAFLPEGGNLVLNTLNYVAFKAIDETGKGISVNGKIADDNDSLITTFHTDFQGMGKLMIMPVEGRSYSAKINGYPHYVFHLINIQPNGIAIHYKDDGENCLFSVSRNIKLTEPQRIYFVASHKGIVLFYKTMEISGFNDVLKVRKNIFPDGITKITLLDTHFNEVAERLLFFMDRNQSTLKMDISDVEFMTRENAEVTLDFVPEGRDSIQTPLSVAVVNKDYFGVNGNDQTMKSYLLLDSELKGTIESPATFFTDEEKITSSGKLDLLMMVQGWRSYYWDDLNAYSPDMLTGWNDAGLAVTGYVKALFRNRPIVGGEVILGPFSRNLLYEETKTDSLGRFRFDRLYLVDSALITLNAKNEKDRANTEIIVDPVFPFQPTIPENLLAEFTQKEHMSMKFYRENYIKWLKTEEFNPEKGNILLGEVEVIGHQREKKDGNFRIYGEPDHSLKIKEEDYTYLDIMDYLQGKVAGLVISGDQISIRGGKTPLFLLDGVEVSGEMVEDLLMHTRMSDIDKIEVLTSGTNMAAFGSKGGDGVIAVYTKKGDVDSEINRYVRGKITQRIRGFRKPSQFYSPQYKIENINNLKPDYRPTLFWESALQVTHNHAEFNFFTSDELADYTVIVEGISKNGTICTATGDFRVTHFYNR